MSKPNQNAEKIAHAITSALGVSDSADLHRVALLVGKVASGELSPPQAQQELDRDDAYLAALAQLSGKTIATDTAQITFGANNQLGDVSIRDVVGGNSVHLTINITPDSVGTAQGGRTQPSVYLLLMLSIIIVVAALGWVISTPRPERQATDTPTGASSASPVAAPSPSSTKAPDSPSPDPAATLVSDGSLQLLLTESGGSDVTSVAISPDGQTLAMGQYDGTVQLWQIQDGTLLHRLDAGTAVRSIAFSQDGQTLSAGLSNTTVRLWHVPDGTPIGLLEGLAGTVYSVAFSPDRQIVAAGTFGNEILLWRLEDGTILRRLTGHQMHVYGLAFSPDGRTLASASSDGTVRLWRVSDGVELQSLSGNDWFRCVAFAPDGSTLAAGSGTTTYLWRTIDGKLQARLPGHSDAVISVAFAEDGQTVLSASAGMEVRRWRVADGARLYTLVEDSVKGRYLQFGAAGTKLAVVQGSTVTLWQVP